MVSEFADGADNTSFSLIEGGDHFYTGLTHELWIAVEGWLGQTG